MTLFKQVGAFEGIALFQFISPVFFIKVGANGSICGSFRSFDENLLYTKFENNTNGFAVLSICRA